MAPRFLFLDRDGVINKKREDDYVKTLSEWEWRDDFLRAAPELAARFEKIVVVTNQRGIGRGLMTEADVVTIHNHMLATVFSLGGRIDGVFYCPHLAEEGCGCRKPKTGLALQAKALFPEIVFSESLLIGDSESDIEMGMALGMKTCFLTDSLPLEKNITKATQIITTIGDIL